MEFVYVYIYGIYVFNKNSGLIVHLSEQIRCQMKAKTRKTRSVSKHLISKPDNPSPGHPYPYQTYLLLKGCCTT